MEWKRDYGKPGYTHTVILKENLQNPAFVTFGNPLLRVVGRQQQRWSLSSQDGIWRPTDLHTRKLGSEREGLLPLTNTSA